MTSPHEILTHDLPQLIRCFVGDSYELLEISEPEFQTIRDTITIMERDGFYMLYNRLFRYPDQNKRLDIMGALLRDQFGVMYRLATLVRHYIDHLRSHTIYIDNYFVA
jgi:hypothetical protein